ncbi:hypothetical protein ACFX2G_030900 [Malus domestica]
MVTNSFFKDCPDKPLKFPPVAIKESTGEEEVAEKLFSLAEKDALKGSDKSMVGRETALKFLTCREELESLQEEFQNQTEEKSKSQLLVVSTLLYILAVNV